MRSKQKEGRGGGEEQTNHKTEAKEEHEPVVQVETVRWLVSVVRRTAKRGEATKAPTDEEKQWNARDLITDEKLFISKKRIKSDWIYEGVSGFM